METKNVKLGLNFSAAHGKLGISLTFIIVFKKIYIPILFIPPAWSVTNKAKRCFGRRSKAKSEMYKWQAHTLPEDDGLEEEL